MVDHVADKHGFHVDPELVDIIKNFPRRSDPSALRGFLAILAISVYFHRLMKGFESILRVLHSVTSGNAKSFLWMAGNG